MEYFKCNVSEAFSVDDLCAWLFVLGLWNPHGAERAESWKDASSDPHWESPLGGSHNLGNSLIHKLINKFIKYKI